MTQFSQISNTEKAIYHRKINKITKFNFLDKKSYICAMNYILIKLITEQTNCKCLSSKIILHLTMKLSQFKFNLPQSLIASHPSPSRDESRLMVLHKD